MRGLLAVLVVIAVVAATSLTYTQQRTCETPAPAVSSSDDSDEEVWTGTPTFFRKAIWKVYR